MSILQSLMSTLWLLQTPSFVASFLLIRPTKQRHQQHQVPKNHILLTSTLQEHVFSYSLSSFPNTIHYSNNHNQKPSSSSSSNHNNVKIDYQSDELKFGRGENHLSAMLNEGDVVAYQTGVWFVDGVQVGDGDEAIIKYCKVENLQIVWTHNCEHGYIRGLSVVVVECNHDNPPHDHDGDMNTNHNNVVIECDYDNFVEFGPEQLIARLPVEWINEDKGLLLVPLPSDLFDDGSFKSSD